MTDKNTRIFPNLYCAGTVKAGTSTLYAILNQHPDIFFSYKKEIMYFNGSQNKGEDWYADYFKNAGDYLYRCDFTPRYFVLENFPDEVMRVSGPETKFIFMLRNPVDRIFSHYSMRKLNRSDEKETIEDMVTGIEAGGAINEYRMINLGFYHRHISRLLEKFPMENIHIIIFEDFIKDIRGEVLKLFRFLGLSEPDSIDYKQWRNRASVPGNSFKAYIHKILIKGNMLGMKRLFPAKIKYKARRLLKRWLLVTKKASIEKDLSICRRLMNIYMEDINSLEKLTGMDLARWIEKYSNNA